MGFPGGSDSKEPACNVGDPGSIPGLGRSPGKGKHLKSTHRGIHYQIVANNNQQYIEEGSPNIWKSQIKINTILDKIRNNYKHIH